MKPKIVYQGAALLSAVRSDRSARAFVWSIWLVMMLVALVSFAKYGQNIPLAEDWLLVSPLTGNEPNLANWLWAQNNEHRIPLPRLILLVLLKATHGDFRAGMFFSIITLGVLSLAMIRVARSLRGGRTSLADAFFPIALLHLGNWENLFWSWQLSLVLPTALTCAVLLVLVSHRALATPGATVVAGISLVLLPLCGASGLVFVPFLALWLGYCGVLHWRAAKPKGGRRWIGGFLIGSAAVALCLTGLYFVGYERPSWTPPNPGLGASLQAAIQFLALGFGPIARSSWVLSTMAAIGILLPSVGVAVLGVLGHKGLERHHALGVLVFFGSVVVFALAMGWGRAGAISIFGGWPIRYVLLAVPILCTAFFVWELYGPTKLRPAIQYGLFLGMCLLLPFNTIHGFEWRNWYRNGTNAVKRDLLAGTPRSILAERHRDFLIHWWDEATLEAHIQMLHDAGIGPFAQMREDPVKPEDSIEVQTTLTPAQDQVSAGGLDVRLQWWEVILWLIGIGMIVGSMALPHLSHFRSAISLSPRLATLQIVAILFGAAILRFNHINQPFTDYIDWRQVSTAMMADNFYQRDWNIFYPEVSWNGPGPSYQGREFQTVSYIAALLYVVIGQHDWIGRSIAVMFGLWGIFALYQLVRRVWDEEHAIASALVMALLPGSIFVERSFIPDPAMVALVVTSFWMLVAYLQTERWHYLLLASVVGMWGFLTKIPGLIVGLPMAYATLAILGSKRKLHPMKLVILGIGAILTLAPVIAYYLWARHLSLTYPPYHFAGSGNWLWDDGLQKWWEQKYFLPKLGWNFHHWIWTKPVIALVLVGLCIRPPRWDRASGAKRQSVDSPDKAPWLFHWWMFAGVIYYLIGAKELVINSWNFHIINPAAAALAGHAIIVIASFANRIARSPAALATVATILLIIGGFGQKHLRNMYNPPWDSTKNYKLGLALRQISAPDDLVVTIPFGNIEPVAIYYSQRRGWSFPPLWPEVGWWDEMIEDNNEAIRLFEKLRTQGADWLGIVNSRRNKLWESNSKFMRHIERTCELKQETPEYAIYRILSPEEAAKLIPSQDQVSVSVADAPLVTQELRYHMPEAGEVFFVWGINGWQVMSGETRPAGTVVKDTVMHTPMDREGDTFVVKLQVPAGATINYGFLITGSRSGASIEAVWDGDQDDLIATEDDVVEIETTLTLARDQVPASVVNAPLVTQEIRYHMPEAGEVFLGWGINGWNVVPEEIRLAGTEVRNKVMHTPMIREGDTFVAKVQVPSGATLDYGFLITERRGIFDIVRPVWNGDRDYQMIVSEDGVIEVKATLTLGNNLSNILDIGPYLLVGIGVLLVTWLSIFFFLRLLGG